MLDEDLPIQRKTQLEKAQLTEQRLPGVFDRMATSPDPAISNAGRLYNGGAINWGAITTRSDSGRLVKQEKLRDKALYFKGTNEGDREDQHPKLGGLSAGGSVYLRGYHGWRETPEKQLVTMAVHEAGHIKTSVYQGASRDLVRRYKDEFRAYWTQPHTDWIKFWERTTLANKLNRIKLKLVGESGTDGDCGYTYFRDAYHKPADEQSASERTFKEFVDSHLDPTNPPIEQLPTREGVGALIFARFLRESAPSGTEVLARLNEGATPILASVRDAIREDEAYAGKITELLAARVVVPAERALVRTELGYAAP